jgi:RNA polymerase sigma factor (sigma-70 family)
VSFASALGLLPNYAAGASIDSEIHWSPWLSTQVSGFWLPEQRTRTALSEFGFSFVGAHVTPCIDPLASAQGARASFALCAGVSVGATFAAVIGQRATDGGSRPWSAIVPSARGRLRIAGPLVLDARVGLVLAAARASFVVDEMPEPTQPGPASVAAPSSTEELAAKSEARSVLASLLDEIDLERRAVFVMFEIEALSCGEIAETLGIPLGTVYSRLSAARKQFDQALSRYNARTRHGGRR